jgi:hypothetical protein
MMRSPKFHPDNVEKEDEGIEQQETKDWKIHLRKIWDFMMHFN